MACSKDDTVKPGDSTGPTQVTECGTLDATQAAQLATTRLEHLGSVGLAALGGIEGSRAVARLLSMGDEAAIEPFVADSQSEIHDGLVELRDKQLVASNVESTTDSSVTFLLKAETVCTQDEAEAVSPIVAPIPPTGGASGTGGASSTGGTTGSGSGGSTATAELDPECVKEQQAHPIRIRISKIACDDGDNVALEVFRDAARERLILAELYAERAELEIDVGAYLRATTYRSSSSSASSSDGNYEETVEPVVSSAKGTLHGTLTLNGANKASGKISVQSPIDVTFTQSDARFQVAAGTDVATIEADGAARTVKLSAALGALDWRARFVDFAESMFNLNTTEAGAAQSPVDLHAAGLRGNLDFDGKSDVITAKNLDLGGEVATAKQGAKTLLALKVGSAEQGAIAASMSGKSDEESGLTLSNGLDLEITYGVEPVMSYLVNPANYLANDVLTISATPGASVSLFSDAEYGEWAVTSNQTGQLLSVESGTMTMKSEHWPSDDVSVPAGQCLTRTPQSLEGHHDLLDDFVVGVCGN
jgi:hypothetical protein